MLSSAWELSVTTAACAWLTGILHPRGWGGFGSKEHLAPVEPLSVPPFLGTAQSHPSASPLWEAPGRTIVARSWCVFAELTVICHITRGQRSSSTGVVFSRWQRVQTPERGGTSDGEIFPTRRSTAEWEEVSWPKQAHPNPSLLQTPPPSPWKSRDSYPGWAMYSSELSAPAQAPQILTVRRNLTPVVIQDTKARLQLLISLWWCFSSSPLLWWKPWSSQKSNVDTTTVVSPPKRGDNVALGGTGSPAGAGTELSSLSLPQISTQTNVSCSNKPVEGIN